MLGRLSDNLRIQATFNSAWHDVIQLAGHPGGKLISVENSFHPSSLALKSLTPCRTRINPVVLFKRAASANKGPDENPDASIQAWSCLLMLDFKRCSPAVRASG
jgi:hypothetical protein